MRERVWVVDDVPSRRFPIYTRGNVGEVFPDVVSPLSWSAYGGEAELGWREAWRDYGVLLDRDVEGEDKVVVGCFGGYCYLNASYIRVFAVRTPGINVADMDGLFFGESDAPPYRPRQGDKSAVASLRIARTILGTLTAKALPELDDDKARVREWLATVPEPTTASDRALLDVTNGFRPLFRHLYRRHILTTFRVFIGSGALAQICENKLGDPTLLTPLLAGIGSVESAEPSWAMWRSVESQPTTPQWPRSSTPAWMTSRAGSRSSRRRPPSASVRRLPRRVRFTRTERVGEIVADVGHLAAPGAGRHRSDAPGRRGPRS